MCKVRLDVFITFLSKFVLLVERQGKGTHNKNQVCCKELSQALDSVVDQLNEYSDLREDSNVV
jgi:hypothetical protein